METNHQNFPRRIPLSPGGILRRKFKSSVELLTYLSHIISPRDPTAPGEREISRDFYVRGKIKGLRYKIQGWTRKLKTNLHLHKNKQTKTLSLETSMIRVGTETEFGTNLDGCRRKKYRGERKKEGGRQGEREVRQESAETWVIYIF